MSSGLGLKGNVGRCYQYFEDFASCMKVESDGGQQAACKPLRNDYLECLHHKKEASRLRAMENEVKRQENGGGDDHGGH